MRLLHTSDWHLGRSFHREDLLSAQGQFVDHLVDTVRREQIDVVLVSGDIYDRALPPVDAVALANEALRRLLDAHVRVVLTSGNHDSAQRLGFAASLIDSAGIHLRTQLADVGKPVIVGDDGGEVAFYGLPYLEPDLVRGPWAVEGRSHQAVLDEAMHRVRTDLAGRAPNIRSVVLAHAFVVGATPSDSERDISVGGVGSVRLDTFTGVDYAALGHLHGRHTLSPRVRYSGSPLAYSFSEAQHRKGSWLVELGPGGEVTADFIEAPVPRRLALIRGRLDDLLSDPAWRDAETAWVQATITDSDRPRHAIDRLRRRFPHALVLKFEPTGGAAAGTRAALGSRVQGRSDEDVLRHFFEDVRGSAPTAGEAALLQRACEACRQREAAAS